MKKIVLLACALLIFVTCIGLSYADTTSTKKTPETVYNEICKIFGPPGGQAKRNVLVKEYGEGTAEDQLMVFDSGERFFLMLNRPDKPNETVAWEMNPATEKNYKNLYKILHKYTKGYGISENDRCLYFKMVIGESMDCFACDTSAKADNKRIFHNIDDMIKQVVSKMHPQMMNWVQKELLKD